MGLLAVDEQVGPPGPCTRCPAWRHGGQQGTVTAQLRLPNSDPTGTLPRSSRRLTGWPATSGRVESGAGSPTRGLGFVSWAAVRQAALAADRFSEGAAGANRRHRRGGLSRSCFRPAAHGHRHTGQGRCPQAPPNPLGCPMSCSAPGMNSVALSPQERSCGREYEKGHGAGTGPPGGLGQSGYHGSGCQPGGLGCRTSDPGRVLHVLRQPPRP